jgi:uncharacterized protein (UPF0371 family)
MALNPEILKTAIKAAMVKQSTRKTDPEGALEELSSDLADAIDQYLKSATVIVTVTSPSPGSGTGIIQ